MIMSINNVIQLDAFRRDWTVGIIYCAECQQVHAHMWVTGASVTRCPGCDLLIDIEVNYSE